MGTAEDAIVPSEHEGVALALMSWVPFPLFRNLTSGGAGLPADPVRTLGDVCTTVTIGHESCAAGADAMTVAPGAISIRSRGRTDDPVAALFTANGTASLGGMSYRELVPAVTPFQLHVTPGVVVDLDLPVTLSDRRQVVRGYELPALDLPDRRYVSLAWRATLDPATSGGSVWLEVCDQGHGVQGPTLCFFSAGDVTGLSNASRWDVRGLRFVAFTPFATSTGLNAVNGRLLIGSGTVRVIFPFPVQWAQLTIDHHAGTASVAVKGIRGAVLDTRPIPRNSARQDFVIEDLGAFVELLIVNADAAFLVSSVCIRAGFGDPDTALGAPLLAGERVTGEVVPWSAQEVASQQDATGRLCRQILYTAPDSGGWSAIDVPPMLNATIRVVGICGLTTTLEQIRVRDQDARDTLKNAWNLKAGLLSDTRPLLDPDSDYAINVTMQFAGWRPEHSGEQPPATVADSDWSDWADAGTTRQTFHFHTAAETITSGTALPPVELLDETTFDPRSVARYLLGFDPPTPDGPPVFLGDAVRVHFEVDHVEQLLDRYDRQLVVTVRRTDPPAGTVSGGRRVTATPIQIARQPLDSGKQDAVDRRVGAALASGSPCLPAAVNTGGVTLAITGELEPDAAYDLLVCAPAAKTPADETFLIGRTHFRSSRFADVTALLAGLGFLSTGRAPLIPFDFVIANGGVLPGAEPGASDRAFEDALRAIGMDPWPLVDFGRTVMIWRPDPATAGNFLCAGLLLELPEPIERGDRCGVVQVKIGTHALTTIRVNSAGTRVLLAPATASGIALRGSNLTLELQMRDGSALVTGTRLVKRLPRIAYQEAL